MSSPALQGTRRSCTGRSAAGGWDVCVCVCVCVCRTGYVSLQVLVVAAQTDLLLEFDVSVCVWLCVSCTCGALIQLRVEDTDRYLLQECGMCVCGCGCGCVCVCV